MKTQIILLFYLFSISFHVNCQTVTDTIEASRYFKKADSLLADRRLDSAIVFFKKALPIYQKAEAWERMASCYNKISEGQWRDRKFEASFKNANQALHLCKAHLSMNHPEVANAYDNLGNYNESIPDYLEALEFYQKALKIREKRLPEYHSSFAISYINIGIINSILSDEQEALRNYKKALKICLKGHGSKNKKTASVYVNIGQSYDKLGEYENAFNNYDKALEIFIELFGGDHIETAPIYLNIGGLSYKVLQFEEAINYYEKAETIFQKDNNEYALSFVYNNMGALLSDVGKFESALQYHQKTLSIRKRIFGENHPKVANCYLNIGSVYSDINDIQKAINYFNKALEINLSIFDEENNEISVLYANLGDLYRRKKNFKIAIDYYEKALKIRYSIFGENHHLIAKVYKYIGDLYADQNKFGDAILQYNKSLKIAEKLYTDNSSVNIDIYNAKGAILSKMGKQEEAIEVYNKSLNANRSSTNDKGFNNFTTYKSLLKLLETIQGKALSLKLKYLKTKQIKDNQEASELYVNADKLINYIRKTYKSYEDKLFLSQQANKLYNDAIQLCMSDNKKEDAFYFSEQEKSNSLKDIINVPKAQNFSGLTKDIIIVENKLERNKALFFSKIFREQSKDSVDKSKIKEYQNKLFDINRKQDSLTEVLEQNYPKYYQLKYQNDVVSIDEIQNKLSHKATLLEFFVSDSNTYVFSISKNDFDIKELKTPNLTQNIEELRSAIINKDIQLYKKKAHLLYTALLAPVKEKLIGNELIIIPDESLWHLNFDLLLSQEDASNNPKELPYLISDYAISYANSATLLFQDDMVPVKKKKNLNTCLAFSFSDSSQVSDSNTMSLATLRDTGDDLPGTRKEIKAIADIIDGQYFFGAEASEARFKENASQYGIIHLALHGEIDDEQPENSKLFFTKSKDTLEDHLLYAHELFALEIPAELVVLSACNTGSGKIAKGEGVMSLGTAFQYAGTKSLVLTGWEISDQTTPELMKYFYGNLKEGMDKSRALQQAKLQYLQSATPNRAHPLYWGGFYLVGDHGAMDLATGIKWYWIVGYGVLGIVLLLIFYFKKRKAAM